jgi:hypothetical protein
MTSIEVYIESEDDISAADAALIATRSVQFMIDLAGDMGYEGVEHGHIIAGAVSDES